MLLGLEITKLSGFSGFRVACETSFFARGPQEGRDTSLSVPVITVTCSLK